MNPSDLAKILDELGQRLGPTGEHVFQLAVKQVYIDAIISIVGSALGLVALAILSIVGAHLMRKRWEADKIAYAERDRSSYHYISEPDWVPYGIVGGIVGFMGLSAAGFLVSNILVSISPLLNPEYAALRNIIAQIKP